MFLHKMNVNGGSGGGGAAEVLVVNQPFHEPNKTSKLTSQKLLGHGV